MDINIITPNNQSSQALKEAIEQIDTPYFILSTRPSKVTLDSNYIERVIKVAESYNADWVYSDYRKSINGKTTNNPSGKKVIASTTIKPARKPSTAAKTTKKTTTKKTTKK